VTHTVTDRGERELSIETGKWDETVRIRFWMPLDRLPVDPDFTDADTCIRNLGNYVRLIEAHLGRISKAVRARGRKADEHSSTRSAIEIQARRIAAFATSWTSETLQVESDTPWSGMVVHELGKDYRKGRMLGNAEWMEAWANPPSIVTHMNGGMMEPLILSVSAHRTDSDGISPVEAMRAAANLPAIQEIAA
jgi:hypothetical protein